MFSRKKIIQFPGNNARAAQDQRIKQEARARADALPPSLRELNVAWIFEAAARRELPRPTGQ